MKDGKKSTAEGIVYEALALIGERTGKDPIEVMEAVDRNVTPALEVKSRRVGGATYQVPVEVAGAPRAHARHALARPVRARAPREDDGERLANELLDAQSRGWRVSSAKDDLYRMAQANKAFAHYRW